MKRRILISIVLFTGLATHTPPLSAQDQVPAPVKKVVLPTAAELKKRLDADKLRTSAPQEIEVEFVWNYKKGFPYRLRLFELSSSAGDAVGMNRNGADYMSHYPVQRELTKTETGHHIKTRAGKSTLLLAVVENVSNTPIYFYAAPHGTYPAELNLGAKFFCLCFGHLYRVDPQSAWTRVISLRITPSTRSSYLKFTHDVFLADAKQVEKTMETEY